MQDFSRLLRSGLSFCAILAVAAGCSGSQTQTSALVPGQSGTTAAQLSRLGVGSSMAPDVQSSDLLYVGDPKDGSVRVYSFPSGKPPAPQRACAARRWGRRALRRQGWGRHRTGRQRDPQVRARGHAADRSAARSLRRFAAILRRGPRYGRPRRVGQLRSPVRRCGFRRREGYGNELHRSARRRLCVPRLR